MSSILREELHIYNIRKRRPSPGLRPQHLEAVLTAGRLCNAEVKGAKLGSREIWFVPGEIRGGRLEAEIGTAGSIPMLILTVLPICLHAKREVELRIRKGGTDTRNAPTINFLRYILLPTLRKMGVEASVQIRAYGYYPVGMGEVILRVTPCRSLKPLKLREYERIRGVNGISICTFLEDKRVADRQATSARKILEAQGYKSNIEVVYDSSNPTQKGSSLVLWAETDSGAIIGGDAIGELRKSSEKVGREAANNLLMELKAKVTSDIHLGDMIIPYIGLAKGFSTYTVREFSEHLDTNIWLTETLLETDFQIKKERGIYRVTKTG
jgi:RNA 3'-phosphate cyclase